MSTQQLQYSDQLKLLEAFRIAAWGKNPFIKESTRTNRTIKYLAFGEHLQAVRFFCQTAKDKLVVFKEYGTAVDNFKEQDVTYEDGACIIGQPGIGKTCFIAYAVVVRLLEKQPVAVQISWRETEREYLLFTSNAVTIHDSAEIVPLLRHPGIWAFSDSNVEVFHPMITFRNAVPDIRVFQTTSPAKPRWKEWTKQCDISLYTMNLPSIEEVEDVAFVLRKDISRMKALAEKWGPVPRILLRILRNSAAEAAFEEKVIIGVGEAVTNPRVVFPAIADYNSENVQGSSAVFFIKPKSIIDRDRLSVFIPTPWLADQLVEGLFRFDEDQRDNFFRVMSYHHHARSTQGWMFESVAHRFLARGEFPITWFNTVTEIVSHGPLPIHSVDADLKGLNPPYYWLPAASNFPGIDAAIVTTDRVFGIQSTVQFEHGAPTQGLRKLRSKFAEDSPMRDWLRYNVLFVGSSEKQAKSVCDQHAGNLKVGDYIIPVGWLTVPMGPYSRQFFVSCGLDRKDLFIHVFCMQGAGLETTGTQAGTSGVLMTEYEEESMDTEE